LRKRIYELADIQVGFHFREKLKRSSAGKVRVIQTKDVDRSHSHQLDTTNLYRISPTKNIRRYEVFNGNVIFLSKGRRNNATFIEGLHSDLPTIVAGYFFILRIKNQEVLPEYLAWSINQQPAQAYLQRVARGSGMPFIPKDAFSSLEIDVPPVKIQKLIIKLHKLSLKEENILTNIKTRRNELLQGICLKAAKSTIRS